MTREEFRNYLMDTLPGARLTKGGDQIVCICPYCGDTTGHCYIGPFLDDTRPVMHNCFKCDPSNPNKSGIVNQTFMNAYNCWMPDGFASTPVSKDGFRAKRITGRTLLDLENKYVTDTNLSRKKLTYINERLGINMSYNDALRYKIVINMSDLLNGNQITKYTRNINDMNTFDQYFIGALGVNNNMISLRNLMYQKDNGLDKHCLLSKKYVNYVVNDNMNTDKFYIVPTQLNTFLPVNIHVCEGFMDALGIHFNLHNGCNNNDVIIAGFGKSYSEAVEYVLSSYPFTIVNVHLYPDADVNDYAMNSVVKNITPLVDSIFCHRNICPGQKDYGVPKAFIQDSWAQII